MTQKFLIYLFLALLPGTVAVSAQTLPLRHYSIKDGLASASVNCIFQDSRGYLWAGTQHGLSRFDGLQFRNYYVKDGLLNDNIQVISEDSQGKIWVGTENGGVTTIFPGGFENYLAEDGLPHNRVFAITEDRDGNIWAGTYDGIAKYDGNQCTFIRQEQGLIDNYVTHAVADPGGGVWFGTVNGLCFLEGDRFLHYTTGDGLGHNEIQALFMDRRGRLWIGTLGGLSLLEKDVLRTYTTADGLPADLVRAIAEDRDGNLWLGTENGLSYFGPSGFTNFTTRHGIPNDKIYAIHVDNEGNTWFGTRRGLSRLHSLRFVNYSDRDGLPNNLIWTMIQDEKGRFWFGTDEGLSVMEKDTFKNLSTRDGLVNDSVYALLEDRRGQIWIGTNGGLSIYSGKKFRNLTVKDGLPADIVLSFAQDSEGVVWIGTNRGLCRYHENKISAPPFPSPSRSVHTLLEDREKNLWFSTAYSLVRVSPSGKRAEYTAAQGLVHNEINSLFEDGKGRLWISTPQGLSCFRDGAFTNYTTVDGLADDSCYFTLEDREGHLWIGTAKGVNRFDGTHFKHYTEEDGLPSYEMCQRSCLLDRRGRLWFGTVNGASRFDPRLDRENTVPPPVYISQWLVFGEPYSMEGPRELSYNRNYMAFGFTGISLTAPQDVVYRYRLEGLEHRWFESRNPIMSYPYLPPGDYTFKVTARNKDGVESLEPARLRFRILPPFWDTWWFRAIGLFALLAMLSVALLWRIKREKEKVAERERNKQLVLAQKMELLGVLAGGAIHDLKNLLSVIIGYSKIAGRRNGPEGAGDEKKNDAVEKIKATAATAVQVVKQILAFTRQSYDKTIAANLPDLVDDILEILKVTTPGDIRIIWEHPGKEIRLRINPTRFQQVVMNLCLNAVQAMEGKWGGEIRITLTEEPGAPIILEVADTGSGMDEETASRVFEPLFTTKEPGKGTGLGLFVVKQIVKELGGTAQVESQPGKGSLFRISFPSMPSSRNSSAA